MFAYVLPQLVAHGLSVPIGPSEQMLNTVGRGVARHFGQLPAVLSLGFREQSAQIIFRPLTHLGAGEMLREAFVHRLQLLGPRPHHLPIHRLRHRVLLHIGKNMMPNDHTIYNCSTRAKSRCCTVAAPKPWSVSGALL